MKKSNQGGTKQSTKSIFFKKNAIKASKNSVVQDASQEMNPNFPVIDTFEENFDLLLTQVKVILCIYIHTVLPTVQNVSSVILSILQRNTYNKSPP